MCETNAFIRAGEVEELFFESLSRVLVNGDELTLVGIFGDRKSIKARVAEINFQGGKLLLERL